MHNVRDKRSEAVLFSDSHAEFYKIPADLENHLSDPPDTNYLFWGIGNSRFACCEGTFMLFQSLVVAHVSPLHLLCLPRLISGATTFRSSAI